MRALDKRTLRHGSWLSLVIAAFIAPLLLVGTAWADGTVTKRFNLPVQIDMSFAADGCQNAPGPQITMDGQMILPGLGVDMIFSNNQKGTHSYTDGAVAEQVVVPAGQAMSIPKQPVLGGVGGNPFIWIQLTDEQGRALTSELYLGRCVQGVFHTTASLAMPVTASARFETSDCSNNPGPYITMDGAMEMSALHGRMIFRNNANPVGGPHGQDEDMSIDMVLVPAGQTVRFPKQPVLGGVGGNPWISAVFTQDDGDPIGSEALLGRCVQLSK